MKSLLKKIGLAAKRAASSRGPDGSRHVNINAPQEEKFAGNAIATGKYNIITFVPLFLFSQFKRAANVFFLVISILQQVPNVSPTGQWTTLGPLMIILSISALREIAEDYRRQRDDDQTNNDVTLKLTVNQTTGLVEWAREKWKDIEVGNILKITSGRQFPADLILLASSEPKGMAYIETSNLDGETNLKLKQALPETANYTNDDEISQLRGECEAEAPTKHLYEFYGNIEIGQRSLDGQRIPVDASQLLLRGSQLRNTKFVYGLVVYTGQETKLMKNSRQAPLKQSSVEYSVNYQILYMFLALLVLAIISTIGNILTSKWICYHWYMWNITDVPNAPFSANLTASQASDDLLGGDTECGEVTTTRVVKSLMTFLILYNNVVPISLLVTIEVVKYVQAILISFDEEMEHNGILAKARTSNLNEELGQISYIFTDKTGTLTENIMEFKKCSINGKLYSADEEAADFLNADGTHKSHEDSYQVTMRHLNELFDKREKPHEADRVSIFMRMMAVCQTVVPEINDDMEIEYQAGIESTFEHIT